MDPSTAPAASSESPSSRTSKPRSFMTKSPGKSTAGKSASSAACFSTATSVPGVAWIATAFHTSGISTRTVHADAPWGARRSTPRVRRRVTNGLGLCKIHHSAYDANILGIDPDARVHIRADILEEIDGPMLKHGLQELNASALVLPRNPVERPNRDFLAERFERFRAA